MLPGLTAPVLAGALLLGLAAPAKLRQPLPTVRAMRAVGLPSSPALVRVLAVGELALGGAVLLWTSRPALVALAAAYLAFGVFVATLRRRGAPLSSCGCFGRPDTPATNTHVAVVLAVALVVGVAALTTGVASVPQVVASGPWGGVPLLALSAVLSGLAWAALSVLPGVEASRRLSSPATPAEAR